MTRAEQVQAALGAALVAGDGRPLALVTAEEIFGLSNATWSRAWSAAVRAAGHLEALAFAEPAGLELPQVSSLFSMAGLCPDLPRLVAELRRAADRRKAAQLATGLPEKISSGDGVATLAEIGRLLAEPAAGTEAVFGPVASLAEWRESRPAAWILRGLIRRGGLTAISGKGGSKKSLFLQHALAYLAAGVPGNLLGALEASGEPCRVNLVDGECGLGRLKLRLQELVTGDALPPEVADLAAANLRVWPAGSIRRPDRVVDGLSRLLEEHPCDILAVDPVRVFMPSGVENENDNLEVGRVFDAFNSLAKRFDVGVVVVDHDNRAGGALRGASAKADAAEIIYHLSAPRPDDPDFLVLENKKDRDPGCPAKIGFRLVRGRRSGNCHPFRFEPADLPEDLDRFSAWSAIEQVLRDRGPSTFAEIWTASGLPRTTVQRAITEARQARQVVGTSERRNRAQILALREVEQ